MPPKTAAVKTAAPAAKGAAPKAAKKKLTSTEWKNERSETLFAKKPKSFGIGSPFHKKTDMTHFVKWPLQVRIQRQRAILKQRVKVPAAINQFGNTITKDQASNLFQLLAAYRPEAKKQKMDRLKAAAAAKAAGQTPAATPKPKAIKYGLNHVTHLVESGAAKLVVIAHDVDPIELVVWLPTLCRKMNVPFCIVKGKARLGYLVHKKTASVLAVTEVNKEHVTKLQALVDTFKATYDNYERKAGGLIMSKKNQIKAAKLKRGLAGTAKKF